MGKYRWLIFIGIIAVVFGGLFLYSKIQTASLPQSNGSSNTYGLQDGKVVLTEFVDFQCEACYAYYPTIKQVKEKYKDKITFQIKHFPISNSHNFARLAASYAEAAAMQGKFFELHDKIMEGQKVWQVASDPTTYFLQYAEEVGLNIDQLKVDQQSDQVKANINADLAEVRRIGGDGTPTFAINGKKIDQPDNSVEAFSTVIDQALKDAGQQ